VYDSVAARSILHPQADLTGAGDIYQMLSTNGDTIWRRRFRQSPAGFRPRGVLQTDQIDFSPLAKCSGTAQELIAIKHRLRGRFRDATFPRRTETFVHEFTRCAFEALIRPVGSHHGSSGLADAQPEAHRGGRSRWAHRRRSFGTVQEFLTQATHGLNPTKWWRWARLCKPIFWIGVKNMLLLDVTPLRSALRHGGAVAKIIPRNSTTRRAGTHHRRG
jgi:hypothetical protein